MRADLHDAVFKDAIDHCNAFDLERPIGALSGQRPPSMCLKRNILVLVLERIPNEKMPSEKYMIRGASKVWEYCVNSKLFTKICTKHALDSEF